MSQHRSESDKPATMTRADVANGEGADTDAESCPTRPESGTDDETPHPTGQRQAEENQENDPPA